MRVALCLSGQPRFYRDGYEFIKEFIIKEYGGDDVDVFCHFWWDKEGEDDAFKSTSPWSFRETVNAGKRLVKDDIERGLIELYNPIDIKYDNPENIREKHYPNGNTPLLTKHIKKVYEYKHDHEGKKRWIKYPRIFKKYVKDNLKQIFESQYRVQQMKKKYENDNNFKYDIVVRTRYDIAFAPFWDKENGLKEKQAHESNPMNRFNSRFRLLPSLSDITDVWNGIQPIHKDCPSSGVCKAYGGAAKGWKDCDKTYKLTPMFTQWDTESIPSRDALGGLYDFSNTDILGTPENMQEHAINQIERNGWRAHDSYGMNAQLELLREDNCASVKRKRWEDAIKAGHSGEIWWK